MVDGRALSSRADALGARDAVPFAQPASMTSTSETRSEQSCMRVSSISDAAAKRMCAVVPYRITHVSWRFPSVPHVMPGGRAD